LAEENYSERAFKAFIGTKEGYDYLSKFAAKGQTLYGITFKSDGEFHLNGIDLIYSNFSFTSEEVLSDAVYNYPRGEVFNKEQGSRLQLEVKLNYFLKGSIMTDEFEKDYNDAIKSKNIQKMDNALLMQSVQAIAHETYIDVNYSVMRRLRIPFKQYINIDYNTDRYTEYLNTQKNVYTHFNTQGFNLLKRLNHNFNTGWNEDRIRE